MREREDIVSIRDNKNCIHIHNNQNYSLELNGNKQNFLKDHTHETQMI